MTPEKYKNESENNILVEMSKGERQDGTYDEIVG
jgi:hypothetical protein